MRWEWLNVFLICCLVQSVSAQYTQDTQDTLSLTFKDLPLEIVFDSISYKTGYFFSYNADVIPSGSLYMLKKKNIHVDDLLDILFVGTNLEYVHHEDQIIIRQTETASTASVSTPEKVSITGWVREYESKKPIAGASVYLNGTTIGTVTDEYGNYRLMGVPHGSYVLVFSHVGYETGAYPLKAEKGINYAINGLLDFRIETLKQIEITSAPIVSDDDKPKYLRSFKKEFFGNSANASKCEIRNPEVLDFSYNESTKTLVAEASAPLELINEALGYEIKCDLEHFEIKEENTLYIGKAFFTSLEPENNREKKKWRKNRLEAYNGSMVHFFKNLIHGSLAEKGFTIYHLSHLNNINRNAGAIISERKIITRLDSAFEWKLKFDDYLLVVYDKEQESSNYLLSNAISDRFKNVTFQFNRGDHQQPGPQRSVLKLKKDYLTIDNNGQIKESFGLTTYGYWSWERMADMMPADYDPKKPKL